MYVVIAGGACGPLCPHPLIFCFSPPLQIDVTDWRYLTLFVCLLSHCLCCSVVDKWDNVSVGDEHKAWIPKVPF